jgi:ADP-heptose:LPS heptosyltransferase
MGKHGSVGETGGIALFRALKLGDLLCAVPAFRAVRRARPDVPITLIGLPWAEAFAARFGHLLDAFMPFDGWHGLAEQELGDPATFVEEARARRFELAIQMHGSGVVSNEVVVALGAATTGGFTTPRAAALDPELSMLYPDHLHEVRRHLALVEELGFGAAGEELEFPISDVDRRSLGPLGVGDEPDVAIVHCGAISGRRWSPERFAMLVDELSRDLRVALTGSSAERDVTARVAALATSPVIDLAGRTTLGGLAALIERARIVVTNDTGVSHLTAAVGTPSVVLFLTSDPRRWAPLDAERHRAVVHPAIAHAHDAHPERSGALREGCLVGGCRKHRGVGDADPDAIAVGTVVAQCSALLERRRVATSEPRATVR